MTICSNKITEYGKPCLDNNFGLSHSQNLKSKTMKIKQTVEEINNLLVDTDATTSLCFETSFYSGDGARSTARFTFYKKKTIVF